MRYDTVVYESQAHTKHALQLSTPRVARGGSHSARRYLRAGLKDGDHVAKDAHESKEEDEGRRDEAS